MAASRDQYTGIHADYGEDPRGVPAAAPSRGPFIFPSLQAVDEDLAMDYLGAVFVYFTVFGLAFLAVGVIAIVLPILFTAISVQQMVSWMLVIGGLVAFLHFFLVFGAPGTTSLFLLGILHLGIGLWLLIQARVRRGITFVWLILGWFIVHGLIKLLMGYEVRSLKAWPAVSVAGGAAFILGILNIALAPTYGLAVLGILFGVDLAITALAFLLVSMVAYQAASRLSTSRDPLLEQH